MVRLKARTETRTESNTQFQFHYGTIKSHIATQFHVRHLRYFNSTMVRLKDGIAGQGRAAGGVISIPLWYD